MPFEDGIAFQIPGKRKRTRMHGVKAIGGRSPATRSKPQMSLFF
jgi:hypothetical protein